MNAHTALNTTSLTQFCFCPSFLGLYTPAMLAKSSWMMRTAVSIICLTVYHYCYRCTFLTPCPQQFLSFFDCVCHSWFHRWVWLVWVSATTKEFPLTAAASIHVGNLIFNYDKYIWDIWEIWLHMQYDKQCSQPSALGKSFK